MEPIHQAAYDGNEAEVSRLVQEDGRRLNSQIQDEFQVQGRYAIKDYSPLMLAAWKGRDTMVARLIELGADVGLADAEGDGRQGTGVAGADVHPRWSCCSMLARHSMLATILGTRR